MRSAGAPLASCRPLARARVLLRVCRFGIMLGTCVHTGFFMLLAGLVLNSSENVFQRMQQSKQWSSRQYNAYVATFGFA